MFARLAYRLGLSRASGAFVLEGRSVVRVVRGVAATDDKDVLGRRVFESLSRLAGDSAVWFQRGDPQAHVVRSFPLVTWARTQSAPFLGEQSVRIIPELSPPLELLDETDRALVIALRSPRTPRELASLARAPRFRVSSLLGFLEAMGALAMSSAAPAPLRELAAGKDRRDERPAFGQTKPRWVAERGPRAAALELLGLSPEAEWADVRRAFRALARRLHPDLHVGLTADQRRELELRLAKINAAYAALAPL